MSNIIDEHSERIESSGREFEIKIEIKLTVRDTYRVTSNLYEVTDDEEWLDIAEGEVEEEGQTQAVIDEHIDQLKRHALKLVRYDSE